MSKLSSPKSQDQHSTLDHRSSEEAKASNVFSASILNRIRGLSSLEIIILVEEISSRSCGNHDIIYGPYIFSPFFVSKH